jgi:hypothetical protein
VNNKLNISEKERRKAGLLLLNRIYFNKRFRETVKKDFTQMREVGVKLLESYPNTATLKVSKDRVLAELMIDCGNLYLDTVKKAERNEKYHNQRGEFILFNKKDTYVFNNKILRDKKIREGNIIFASGLPKHTYKKATLLKRKIETTGFKKIDYGKYHFKQNGSNFGYYHFWGKKEKYFMDFDNGKVLSKDKKEIELRFKRSK